MATPAPATSFVDDQFGGIQFGADPEPEGADLNTPILPGQGFEDMTDEEVNQQYLDVRKVNTGAPTLTPEIISTPPAVTPPEPVEFEPETIQLDDGSTVTIERSGNKIKATLDPGPGNGGKEVFHARDDQELSRQLLVAKVNATRKIRQLSQAPRPVAPAPAPAVQSESSLTPDQQAQIKLGMAADPIKALDTYISAKLGMSLDQVREQLKEGSRTRVRLLQTTATQEAKDFRAEHPEYAITHNNFQQMSAYLLDAHKIAVPAIPAGGGQEALDDAITGALIQSGVYTKENLNAAFEALAAQDMLDLLEEAPEPPTQPIPTSTPAAPVTPAAPAQPARIVRSERRLNAPYGIHARETTQSPTPLNPRGPSAEEIDSMPDAELSELLAGVRRLRNTSRR